VKALGQIASFWPHLEDAMIEIMRDLLGSDRHMPARQIFRAIISNQARKKVMVALLEKSRLNRDKTVFYDETIQEFSALAGKRNDYLHGLWWTFEDGRVFLSKESLDDFHFLDRREVKLAELVAVFKQMDAFHAKIRDRPRASLLRPP